MERAELLERWAEFQRYGCTSIPVDLDRLAIHLSTVVEELPLSDQLDGAAIPMPEIPDRHLVVVNRRRGHRRKRFKIGHELAHVLLHMPSMAMVRGRLQSSSVKWEANRLAACPLMPRPAVLETAEKTGGDVGARAAMFGLSRAAMKVRLEQLGYRERSGVR